MAFFVGRDETVHARLPRGIVVRRGSVSDEPATFEVMRRAMGFEMNWAHHAEARRHLRTSPDSSYWLAEETPRFGKNRVIGYAHSMVREGVWHLTEFFVLPTYHRQGIGGVLLDCCLQDGAQAGAHTRFVLASHHPAADALYIRKADCFPRMPMFLLAGPAQSLRPAGTRVAPIEDALAPAFSGGLYSAPMHDAPPSGPSLRAEPLILTPEIRFEIDALDREGVGFARTPEHEHWEREMGGPQGAARLFRWGADAPQPGRIVGYAYCGRYSSGPALALEEADMPRMLAHVAGLARTIEIDSAGDSGLMAVGEPYWAVPGVNATTLRWLLRCGWQIVFQYLFMSTRPLGRPERYVCHNPLHFL